MMFPSYLGRAFSLALPTLGLHLSFVSPLFSSHIVVMYPQCPASSSRSSILIRECDTIEEDVWVLLGINFTPDFPNSVFLSGSLDLDDGMGYRSIESELLAISLSALCLSQTAFLVRNRRLRKGRRGLVLTERAYGSQFKEGILVAVCTLEHGMPARCVLCMDI